MYISFTSITTFVIRALTQCTKPLIQQFNILKRVCKCVCFSFYDTVSLNFTIILPGHSLHADRKRASSELSARKTPQAPTRTNTNLRKSKCKIYIILHHFLFGINLYLTNTPAIVNIHPKINTRENVLTF